MSEYTKNMALMTTLELETMDMSTIENGKE